VFLQSSILQPGVGSGKYVAPLLYAPMASVCYIESRFKTWMACELSAVCREPGCTADSEGVDCLRRFAMANPQKVVKLDAGQTAVVRARCNRASYTSGRGPRYPHTRHRFSMRPPGFKTVLGANLLLFWALFNSDL
jgi:hypothetical protein